MAVKIRLKQMGRKHRPFYRICAMDVRRPRGGRTLEELGTYDPLISDTDARVVMKADRVSYWLGVGAQPTEKVRVLIKKYGEGGTHLEKMNAARERLALPKVVPPPGEPAVIPQKQQPAEDAAAADSDTGETASAETATEPAAEGGE